MAKPKQDPLPDEKQRLKVVVHHLRSVIHYSESRFAETEESCTCSAADLRPDGDGPCNWCEQMIFAWNALVTATAAMHPLVRKQWASGLKLDADAFKWAEQAIKAKP